MLLAILDKESAVTEEAIEEDDVKSEGNASNQEVKKQARPCELYVCNLPRNCDIAELVEMFKPFGTVLAAEVDTNFAYSFVYVSEWNFRKQLVWKMIYGVR